MSSIKIVVLGESLLGAGGLFFRFGRCLAHVVPQTGRPTNHKETCAYGALHGSLRTRVWPARLLCCVLCLSCLSGPSHSLSRCRGCRQIGAVGALRPGRVRGILWCVPKTAFCLFLRFRRWPRMADALNACRLLRPCMGGACEGATGPTGASWWSFVRTCGPFWLLVAVC